MSDPAIPPSLAAELRDFERRLRSLEARRSPALAQTIIDLGALETALAALDAEKVDRAGDTMTGTLVLPPGPNISGTGGGALQVGAYGSEPSIGLDSNEIQSYDAAGAPAALFVNANGGEVRLSGGGLRVLNTDRTVKDHSGRHFLRASGTGPQVVKHGNASGTTDGSGDFSVTFSTPFTSTPTVIPIRQATASLERTLHLVSVTTSGFTVRAFNGGTLATSQAITVYWLAIGAQTTV